MGPTLVVGLSAFALALAALAVADRSSAPERPSERDAIRSALSNHEIRSYLDRSGYTRERTIPLDDKLMRVSFFNGSRIVLDTAVAADGTVPYRLEYSPGYIRAGNGGVQTPLALIVMSGVFALAAACVPLRRMRNLDVLVLLSFSAAILLLNERLFELSVWVSYPPLAYLGARCLRVALARPTRTGGDLRPLYDAITVSWDRARRVRVLGIAAIAAGVALVLVSVLGGEVGDVGFASMAGATGLLHGTLPYGHLPPELVHGDTYPLLAYAMYIPAALVMPVNDAFDNLDGALLISAAGALIAGALVYRLSSRAGDEDGRSQGLRHTLAWLAFPPVVITASSGSNDLVAAAWVAGTLALAVNAARSTTALAVAGWVKLIPLFLLPFWAARFRPPSFLRAVAAPALVVVVVLGWILILDGTRGVDHMVDAVSFQSERGALLSIWTLIGSKPLQLVFQAAVLSVTALAVLWVWRDRALAGDVRRLAALAGAIMIGFQLGANYWSYAYLPWVMPCLVLALLTAPSSDRAPMGAPRG
jgi:glycosyl transferase family 87